MIQRVLDFFRGKPPFEIIPTVKHATTGQADGEISVEIKGGSNKFEVVWNEKGLPDDLQIPTLKKGKYTIQVTDKVKRRKRKKVIEVKEFPKLEVAGNVTPSVCDQGNGEINLEIKGGSGPENIQVDWEKKELKNNKKVKHLAPGIYNVQINDKGAGTTQWLSYEVEKINPLKIYVNNPIVIKSNESHGMIRAKVEGGSGDYSYFWSSGIDVDSPEVLAIEGVYNLQVLDNQNKCRRRSEEIRVIKEIEKPEPIPPCDWEEQTNQPNSNSSNCSDSKEFQVQGILKGRLKLQTREGKEPLSIALNEENESIIEFTYSIVEELKSKKVIIESTKPLPLQEVMFSKDRLEVLIPGNELESDLRLELPIPRDLDFSVERRENGKKIFITQKIKHLRS